jgi:hypothetical protein
MSNNISFYGNSFITTGDKKFGLSSLSLGGSGDYVETSLTNDFNFKNLNYCVEGFFKFNEIKSGKNILISKEDYGSYDYKLYYDNDSSGIFWDLNGLSPKVSGRADLNIDQWYHIAATREGNDHNLWLNMTGLGGVTGSVSVGAKTNDRFILGHAINPHKVVKSITIDGETFAMTTKTYKHGYKNDLLASANASIQRELGNGWELASWEDFEGYTESQLESILEAFGVDFALQGSPDSSDYWVGWLKKDNKLLHFETFQELASFHRCYLLAFHNKESQEGFEYFDNYHSKYVALTSWISDLPYIAKKTSEIDAGKDSANQDFNGYVDGFRISLESFRYSPNYYSNTEPTEIFVNDSNTSLLLDFEGTHQGQETSDLSFTDISIIRPQIQIDSFYPESGTTEDLIRISGKALEHVTHVILSGREGDVLQVPGADSIQASLRPDYPSFTVYDGTGLYFELPSSVKDNESFVIKNANNIIDSSRGNIDFESHQSTQKFRITSPRINNFYPNIGVYGDTITIEGTRIDANTKFFFREYSTGSAYEPKYIPPLETNVINYTGATVTVPREIIKDFIYISGGGKFSKSKEVFTPLPTVSGIDVNNLEIGSNFRVTGINSTQAYPVLFVTGNCSDLFYTRGGQEKYCTSALTKTDVYDLDQGRQMGLGYSFGGTFDPSILGDGKLFYSEGCSILTGTIRRNFVGTGNMFLWSSHDKLIEGFLMGATEFDSNSFSSHINSTTGETIVVKELAPSGVSFYPRKGNSETLITASGNYLLTVTGLKFEDSGAGESCSIPKTEFVNIIDRGYSVGYNQIESGVYGIAEGGLASNSYLKDHYINFNVCNLTSGKSGDIYVMTPNYTVKMD